MDFQGFKGDRNPWLLFNGMQSSFQDIALRWLADAAPTVSPGTTAHYRLLLETHVVPRLGGMDVAKVGEGEVCALVEEKRAEGMSESTVGILSKLIFRILSYGSSEGLCAAPEWRIGSGRPRKVHPTVILTVGEEQRLLTFLTDNPSPKHLGIYLILTAGLGVGEVRKLTWADVSLPQRRIRVLTEEETSPDTRNKYRNIAVNERQKLYLKRMASLPSVYVASGKPEPVSAWALRDSFLRALRAMGLPEMPLSDLRRTFAVRRLEQGMGYVQLSEALGQENTTNFRALYRELVSPETRERLEREWTASRKVRQAPSSIRPPEKDPTVRKLEEAVEARKKQLKETLANLEGDLAIIRTLRNSDLATQGKAREGFYRFVEKVLGDDRDGKMLVEYLRCNMRVADMPSRKEVTVQTIRARVARGFEKLGARLEEIYALADVQPGVR